jgi:hypothetical protein
MEQRYVLTESELPIHVNFAFWFAALHIPAWFGESENTQIMMGTSGLIGK